jgi:hypothetical protein
MAKIGDHVATVFGNATVISGKRVLLHGKQNIIKAIEKGVVKGVLRTKEQVDQYSTDTHKMTLKELAKSKANEKKAENLYA